jgi:hypothetical protein
MSNMMKPSSQAWFSRLGGYLLIPHELLHVLGFRLVGKRCTYRWGESYVTPLEPMSRWQLLVGRLFPFIVFTLLFIICVVLAGLAYQETRQGRSIFWFLIGLGMMQILALYAGTTLVDLRNAYLLIVNKPWYSKTPLDLFFWPIVDWDEIRDKIPLEDENAKQG